jgi:sialate O-acetylesterase
VSSAEVPQPVAVRFGWADFPVVNLWNRAGLPACPFRTDDFPMITAPKAPVKTSSAAKAR